MPPHVATLPTTSEDIVARLRGPRNAVPGYQLNRVLLCNYWHFGLLTFEVPHGRLFLTGDNATGKSTALVAAMLTLDGDLRPHRLDTFGSAERQIAAYVLGTRSPGTSGAYEHTARTSLVATEWVWQGQPDAEHPAYLTLGLTFVGNAGNADPVRSWRFLLLDGARLNKDVELLDSSGRLLDARTLRSRLGSHGQVHDRVETYKLQVAQQLFGFRDRRDMDRLIDWLLLLRKPNLTSRLSSFSEVTEFLRQALPPLPSESTLQLTQTFDHLVALRQSLDERLAVADAVDRILQEQQAQSLALARLRAFDVREVGAIRHRAAARVKDRRHVLARLERDLAIAEQSLAQSRTEVAALDEQIRRLEGSADLRDAAAIRARLASAEAEATRTAQAVQRQRTLLQEAQLQTSAARHACAAAEARWDERVADRKAALDHLRTTLAHCWPDSPTRLDDVVAEMDHSLLLEASRAPAAPLALDTLLDDVRAQVARLAPLVEHHEQAHRARATLAHAEQRLLQADQAVVEEQARVAACTRELADAWRRLTDGIEALGRTGDPSWDLDAVLLHARSQDEAAYRAASGKLDEQLAAQAAEALTMERGLGEQVAALRARAEALAERVNALAGQSSPELGRMARRALDCLAEASIEARPLGALVEVAPGAGERQAGQLERALHAAGLLDALVILPADAEAAAARLAQADIAGAVLQVRPPSQTRARLPLIVDRSVTAADPAWAAVVAAILASLPASLDASATADGSWQHGVVAGRVPEGTPLGLLGVSQREARRQQELDALREEEATLQAERERLQTLHRELTERYDELLRLRARLRQLPEEAGLAVARSRLAQAEEALARVQHLRHEAAGSVEEHRQRLAQLAHEADRSPDDQEWSEAEPRALAARLEPLRQLERDLAIHRALLDGLQDVSLARQSARQRHLEADDHARMLADALAEAERQHAHARADVEALRARQTHARAAEAMRGLDRAREARREAEEHLRAADRQVGVLASRCEDARAALAEVETSAAEADLNAESATAALAAVVFGQPDSALEQAAGHLHQADPRAAAEVLLAGAEIERQSLERAHTSARDRFVRVFAERRPLLAELQPFMQDDAVRLRCGERLLSLPAYRTELEEDIAGRRALITDEEEQLFTAFLLDGAAGQIGEAIRRADAWVEGINAVLARIPLVHERYVLQLRPGNDLSGPLARHYALFRTSPDALSSAQRQALLDALREATAEAQQRHEQGGGAFADELERLLDYRSWLRLEVAVIGASGQRVVLTDRVARTRSGAEQMMAQYVPLFAALSALYDLAAPWAPRLLALDEAFDKASDESSQQMLRFLVGQRFQWLMTSPRLTGQGSAVPVYAEYLMVHDRATRRAYGIPFFAEALTDESSAA